MKFTIAICDDDSEQVTYIRGILKKWAAERMLDVKMPAYSSAEQFLLEYPLQPCDLLLLDIEMGKISGMELAKKLRKEKDALPIVFLTGFSEYIAEGYDVEALHYLLKPIDEAKLCEVLDKYVSRESVKNDEILVKTKEGVMHVRAAEIVSVEAFGRRTEITLAQGEKIACEQSIGQLEETHGFLRCHRSYLVNLRYIRGIGKDVVFLDGGGELPLSRRMYEAVNRAFIAYYKEQEVGNTL